MNISASLVKELRERTGSGMMECKKALTEANGDIEAAIEIMRKAGLAKADKKAGRIAAEGRVVIKVSADGRRAAMVDVNCETDFVAKGDDFLGFADLVGQRALESNPADVEALLQLPLQAGGATIAETRQALIAKIGENITVRRYTSLDAGTGVLGAYQHGSRIGVLVKLEGGTKELAKDIAMHIAASRPVCISQENVPAELVEKEKDILRAQAADSGKPAEIIEKMIVGRLNKYLAEITLVGQPFVKNPDQTVAQLLKEAGAKVVAFQRIEVGEGIEKKQDDFAAEVMAQVRGA